MSEDRADEDFVFYVYEDDFDPRYSFWLEVPADGAGMCLYDRPPEGDGMWLDPEIGGDYDAVEPTDDFEQVLAQLMGDGIDGGQLTSLPAHEQHFVRVIHGTIDENPDGIPNTVWSYLHECAERWPDVQ